MPSLLEAIEDDNLNITIDITYRVTPGQWFWIMYNLKNNFIVCQSCNHHNLEGGYSTKAYAITSARRFIKKYFRRVQHINNHVMMQDGSGRRISLEK